MARSVRIGIINLMPKAQEYEASLLGPLLASGVPVDPVWIRLGTHGYASSDPLRIREYRRFEHAEDDGALDGLLLSGAPIEEMAFHEVVYWPELRAILEHARGRIPSTLGLCWGGLALASLLGIEKTRFDQKLSGVFPLENLAPSHAVLGSSGARFVCPQSRHAGVLDGAIERAVEARVVRSLAYSPEVGYSIFESCDGRLLMHLGHPEYAAERLAFEYRRDIQVGRTDVEAPRHFDLDHPSETWRTHRSAFFSSWVRSLAVLPLGTSRPHEHSGVFVTG
jgi:homoserine O-succinyltransferase